MRRPKSDASLKEKEFAGRGLLVKNICATGLVVVVVGFVEAGGGNIRDCVRAAAAAAAAVGSRGCTTTRARAFSFKLLSFSGSISALSRRRIGEFLACEYFCDTTVSQIPSPSPLA